MIETLANGIKAGNDPIGEAIRKEFKYNPQRPFTELMRDLVGKNTSHASYGMVERFGNWRHQNLLPTEVLGEGEIKVRKNRVVLYLDYSGSCTSLKPVFEKATAQIPRSYYNVETFLFADYVGRSEENIGGGTCFSNVTHHAKDQKYDMVWVFTDGEGNDCNIDQSHVKKWHWFLMPPNATMCIPKGCNIHLLNHFVVEK